MFQIKRIKTKAIFTLLLVFALTTVGCSSKVDNIIVPTEVIGQQEMQNVTNENEQESITEAPIDYKLEIEVVEVPKGEITLEMGQKVMVDSFRIGKYEVKYSEWELVYKWAIANGYTFSNQGSMGYGQDTNPNHPVTIISWRDMIVWCNAASEMMGLEPVYYNTSNKTEHYKSSVVDTDASIVIDENYINKEANGYRLPNEYEWEYAARYVDGTNFNSGFFTSGGSEGEEDAYSWYGLNSGQVTHEVGLKKANALGIYDMCGNVAELCFDNTSMIDGVTVSEADGSTIQNKNIVINRGGGYSSSMEMAHSKSFGVSYPDGPNIKNGFRVVLNN